MNTNENLKNYRKKITSVYEIYLKSVPDSSCSFSSQKNCEDRGQD